MTLSTSTVRAMLERCEASRDMWEKKAIALEHENAKLRNALSDTLQKQRCPKFDSCQKTQTDSCHDFGCAGKC